MHTAHTLKAHDARFSAGMAANFAAGKPADAISTARTDGAGVGNEPSREYAQGVLSASTMAPGFSPLVAARVGLGYDTEAGVTYSGRAIRIDGRWAYQTTSHAVSFGAGASALMARKGEIGSADIAGLDLQGVRGFGFDLPIIWGWRSDAELVNVWAGARGGFDKLSGEVGYQRTSSDNVIGNVNAYRAFGFGVVGLAIGFRHLHAAVELQGGYQYANGTLWNSQVNVGGFSIAPSTALLMKF